METKISRGLEHTGDIRELFKEYTDMLVEGDSAFRGYLDQQDFDRELEHLGEKYGEPSGRLYIVYHEGAAAACAGLIRFDDDACEMKRLYVRPAYRGRGIGRMLTERIIVDARGIGYKEILLDTLPFLKVAVSLYKCAGFVEIPKYNDSPMERAIYMRLDL